jgi:hypothetical protein
VSRERIDVDELPSDDEVWVGDTCADVSSTHNSLQSASTEEPRPKGDIRHPFFFFFCFDAVARAHVIPS